MTSITHWSALYDFDKVNNVSSTNFRQGTAAHWMQTLAEEVAADPNHEATHVQDHLDVIAHGANMWRLDTLDQMSGPDPIPQADLVRTDQSNRFQVLYGFGKVIGSRFGIHSALHGIWMFFDGDKSPQQLLPTCARYRQRGRICTRRHVPYSWTKSPTAH